MSAFDPHGLTGDGTGRVAVALAGTPQALASSMFNVRAVTIQADPANAGPYLFVKDKNGLIMGKIQPGQSFTPPQMPPGVGIDLSQIYIDASTTNDGCYVAYV